MTIEIGSKYRESRANLIKRIRNGDVRVLSGKEAIEFLEDAFPKTDPICYFCGEHIGGKVRILEIEEIAGGYPSLSHYYTDTGCYASAKGLHPVKNNQS